MEYAIAATVTGVLDFSFGKVTFEPIRKKTQWIHESFPPGLNAMMFAAVGGSLAVLATKCEFDVIPVGFAMAGAFTAEMLLSGNVLRMLIHQFPWYYPYAALINPAVGSAAGLFAYELLF